MPANVHSVRSFYSALIYRYKKLPMYSESCKVLPAIVWSPGSQHYRGQN